MSAKMIAASTPSCCTGSKRDLGRDLGLLAHLDEAVAFAQRAVLGLVAARLAHQPDRREGSRFAPAGAQETHS